MQEEKKSVTLRCFTPEVAFATFFVESMLAVYTWFRYRATPAGRRGVMFLLSLALVQVSEYMLCRYGPAFFWMRAAIVGTIFLPPLALDFVRLATKRKIPVEMAYAVGTLFFSVVIGLPEAIYHASCAVTYTAFDFNDLFSFTFGAYYAILMGWGLIELYRAKVLKEGNQKAIDWLAIGYLVGVTPAILVHLYTQVTLSAFPSIYCGFAVLMALVVAFKVMPALHEKLRPVRPPIKRKKK